MGLLKGKPNLALKVDRIFSLTCSIVSQLRALTSRGSLTSPSLPTANSTLSFCRKQTENRQNWHWLFANYWSRDLYSLLTTISVVESMSVYVWMVTKKLSTLAHAHSCLQSHLSETTKITTHANLRFPIMQKLNQSLKTKEVSYSNTLIWGKVWLMKGFNSSVVRINVPLVSILFLFYSFVAYAHTV